MCKSHRIEEPELYQQSNSYLNLSSLSEIEDLLSFIEMFNWALIKIQFLLNSLVMLKEVKQCIHIILDDSLWVAPTFILNPVILFTHVAYLMPLGAHDWLRSLISHLHD